MTPLSSDDVIQVQGRYLSRPNGDRFITRGIAFPDSPPVFRFHADEEPHIQYNVTGWIAVLKQLREALPATTLNTIRLYQLDPDVDYSEFLEAAADLGFYILVPLTGRGQGAVLDRSLAPPKCYPKELWLYGKSILDLSLRHANVLAGVIGNEVMNSLESWHAAPCIKAFVRDLKIYMKNLQQQTHQDTTLQELYQNRLTKQQQLAPLPLLYAAQDSGIGAALNNVDTIRLSLDYLACQDNDKDDYAIDIMGVNVESWCATRDTFQYNDDGTIGTLYQLWQGLHHPNVQHVALVFSELGCSHSRYNLDTPELRTPQGTRDWTEIPVVTKGPMRDTWSGFCAYAYWGNSLFSMMKGGPWNGKDILEPTQDFENFQQQCSVASYSNNNTTDSSNSFNYDLVAGSLHDLPMQNGGVMEEYYQMLQQTEESPTCEKVQEVLLETTSLKLHSLDDLPRYAVGVGKEELMLSTTTMAAANHNNVPVALPLTNHSQGKSGLGIGGLVAVVAVLLLAHSWRNVRREREYQAIPNATVG